MVNHNLCSIDKSNKGHCTKTKTLLTSVLVAKATKLNEFRTIVSWQSYNDL